MVEENTRASSGVRRCTQLLHSLPLVNELLELSRLPQHEALKLKVTDMSNVARVREIRDTLTRLDRMKLALRLCAACDVETYPVYAEWGISLIRAGKFPLARVRVVKAMKELTSEEREERKRDRVRDRLVRKVVFELERHSSRPLQTRFDVLLSTMREISRARLHKSLWPSSRVPTTRQILLDRAGEDISSNQTLQRARKESLWYVQTYGTSKHLLEFLVLHDALSSEHSDSTTLRCGLKSACTLVHSRPESFSPVVFGNAVLEFCLSRGLVDELQNIMRDLDFPEWRVFRPYVIELCEQLDRRGLDRCRYSFEVLIDDHVAASRSCLRLSHNCRRAAGRVHFLQKSKEHIRLAMSELQVDKDRSDEDEDNESGDASSDVSENQESVTRVEVVDGEIVVKTASPRSRKSWKDLEHLLNLANLEQELANMFPVEKLSLLLETTTLSNREDATRRRCEVVAEVLCRGASYSADATDHFKTERFAKLAERIISMFDLSRKVCYEMATS